jgi:hypothetical protein
MGMRIDVVSGRRVWRWENRWRRRRMDKSVSIFDVDVTVWDSNRKALIRDRHTLAQTCRNTSKEDRMRICARKCSRNISKRISTSTALPLLFQG